MATPMTGKVKKMKEVLVVTAKVNIERTKRLNKEHHLTLVSLRRTGIFETKSTNLNRVDVGQAVIQDRGEVEKTNIFFNMNP